ncbi:hypothetical protein ACIBJI_39930 [Nocardia sp. NPDC050408]|uniref:hypothetical protein n=1 Tax=Nocardia sp. NPDC050408 TaxID=3364319 RepID=UPI0037907E5D
MKLLKPRTTPGSDLQLPDFTDPAEHDDATGLPRRVLSARDRLTWQDDPALLEALSEDELLAERGLVEQIRAQRRAQRGREIEAMIAAEDRELADRLAAEDKRRRVQATIQDADIKDLITARKALAEQRRESSPHAKLASLYRHREWSQRALAGVVAAGMLWSAVNVQHNVAPGGPGDPLYWFSFLLEGMISVCLIVIMIGTNKVAEWGILDSRTQVVTAEVSLLALTVGLNTFPYLRDSKWYETAVHAVAPVMIGVAMLIHDAASTRYGGAITKATEQVRELPDDELVLQPTVTHRRAERIDTPAHADPVPALDPAVRAADTRTPQLGYGSTTGSTGPAPVADPVVRGAARTTATGPVPEPVVREGEPVAAVETTAVSEADEAVDLGELRTRTANPQPATSGDADPVVTAEAVTSDSTADPGATDAESDDKATELPSAPVVRTRSAHPAADRWSQPRSAGSEAVAPERQDWMAPVFALATEVISRGTARTKPVEVVAAAIAAIDAGAKNNAIEKETPLSHATIARIRAKVAEIRHEQSIGGGRVIELRKQNGQAR